MSENPSVQILPVSVPPSGGGGPAISANFIERAQDPTEVIESLRLGWQGKQWVVDDNGRPKLEKFGKPLMNTEGVAELSNSVRSLLSKFIMNSAYSEAVMARRIYMFGRELSKLMRYRYPHWEMDLHTSSFVFWQIIFQVDGVYRQALDPHNSGIGAWRETGRSTVSEVRNLDMTPQPSRSMLPQLPFLGRRQ